MKNTTQGFTLIELLIVIAIIGILAAVLIPNLLGARKRAYDTSATSCAKSIQTVQAQFQIDQKRYFNITKSAGTAGAPTLVDSATANALGTTAMEKYAADLNQACSVAETGIDMAGDSQLTVPTGSSATAANSVYYSVEVQDSRGSQKIYVTPDKMVNTAQ